MTMADAGRLASAEWRAGILAFVAAVCLTGAVALHVTEDRVAPGPAVDRPDFLLVRSPAVMKRLSLGNQALAADVYWIRALQHFGSERLSPPSHTRSYALLYPLLDLTTTLDPYFSIAYRFGAIFLGEPYPGGPGRPDLAIALLKKGLTFQPDKWQYMQDVGFVYYWHLQDYKTAASWFSRAADVPGAPTWMRPLAATTLAEGGQRSAARALWQEIAKSDEPWLRNSAQLRLTQLDAMDQIDAIAVRVDAFRRQHPGAAITWLALQSAGLLPGTPLDPSGTPYAIDAATGKVTVSPQSKLFPLPGQLPKP